MATSQKDYFDLAGVLMRRAGVVQPRVWVFVVDAHNAEDLRDLDHVDQIIWGSNPNTRRGDLVLMYRTAPYSDIPYIFQAESAPWRATRSDGTDMAFAIRLCGKIRLERPVKRSHLQAASSGLSDWSFIRMAQGIMQHKDDLTAKGVWKRLRRLIVSQNPSCAHALGSLEGMSVSGARHARRPSLGNRKLRVFVSYAREDLPTIKRLAGKVRKLKWVDPWIEIENLVAGSEWTKMIEGQIRRCDAVMICVSPRMKNGYQRKEIRLALEVQDRQPLGATFVLPVMLAECELRGRLARYQYAELFKRGGFAEVVKSLTNRRTFLAEIGWR